jgi:hypothetical protein
LSLVIDDLDGATVERAGALVAREHATARQMRPELPAGFEDAGVCAAALQHLCDSGHRGLVATGNGRTIAVITAIVRQHPAGGRYARLPAEGFAVDPDLADPTGVLAVAFGDLASPLIADGVLRYYLVHAALPRLPEALSNLGFGRNGAYGVQPAAPRRGSSAVAVRVAGAGTSIPWHAWRWWRYSTAPRRRCSHPAMIGPWPTWPSSTAPCARAAPSTSSPPLTGATSACSPSS